MSKPKMGTPWQESLPNELPRYIKRNIDPGSNGCWVWNRSKDRDGYGWASNNNKTYLAHRLVYAFIRGPIAKGLVLDHLCRNRACVNPAHLEQVTNHKNILRSPIGTAGRDKCLRCGGNFTVVGVAAPQRRCLKCYKEWSREYERDRARGIERRVDGKNSRSGYPETQGQ